MSIPYWEMIYASAILTRFRSPPETPRMKSLPTLYACQLELVKVFMKGSDHRIDCMAETENCHGNIP